MKEKTFVTYEEFGAIGDGVADDFAAIKKAHDYANENSLTVKATPGKTYYISNTRIDGVAQMVIIKTNVVWSGANFIIDDSPYSTHNDTDVFSKNIFHIASDYPLEKICDAELFAKLLSNGVGIGTKKLDLGLGYPALVTIYNSKHNVYRRRGYGSHLGKPMHEIILLDKDGNVSEETPFMFDYNNIDYIDVIRADVEPITVEGGRFTTIACNTNCVVFNEEGIPVGVKEPYIHRGIRVQRSETTLRGIEHYIEGEISINRQKKGEVGAPYHGFYEAVQANHITIESCVMTGRRCYKKSWVGYGMGGGTMGTYDLTGLEVNKIVFKNCTQSNFWVTIDENNVIHNAEEGTPGAVLGLSPIVNDEGMSSRMHWGVGGTNYCKNMEYIGCTLSRFDAHQGLYNGKVIDSTLVALALTGCGEMIVKNSRLFSESHASNNMFGMRNDYGSIWNGSITVDGLKAYVYTKRSSRPGATLSAYNPTAVMGHTYSNWYYGYDCQFPDLSLNNVEVYDIETGELLPEGFEVRLVGGNMIDEPALHCEYTLKTHPAYADVDADGDGFVDGTNIPYDDVVERKGIVDESSYKNVNPIIPPKYMKVTGNACKYTYLVNDMSSFEGIIDGGFFGNTEFITDNETYVGTNHSNEKTETFKFVSHKGE